MSPALTARRLDPGPRLVVRVYDRKPGRRPEEIRGSRPPREADEWLVDMSRVVRFGLARAYALPRAATLRPEPASLTVQAGLDTVAVFGE